MNQEQKNALKSILFYCIAILIVVVVNVSGRFKSGPCTPNLDVLSVFAVVVLSVILLIVNTVKAFMMKKQTRLSAVVHFVALLLWVIVFNSKII